MNKNSKHILHKPKTFVSPNNPIEKPYGDSFNDGSIADNISVLSSKLYSKLDATVNSFKKTSGSNFYKSGEFLQTKQSNFLVLL